MKVVKLINLNHFSKLDIISEEKLQTIYKAKENKTKQFYTAIVYTLPKYSANLNLSGINIHSKSCHPAIIRFIGYSQEDFENNSNPVVIAEYVSNGTLQNLIDKSNDRKPKFNEAWNATKKIINIYGIASAMAYLHKKGIIHRNINPNSILVDHNLYPKITNFECSKLINDLNSDYTMPELIYDAPEVLRDRKYSESSDVYSFGIIMYQIISCMSNNSNSIFHTSNKIVRGERPEISPNMPTVYAQLIKRCLSHDPDDRPSFSEIMELLREDNEFLLQEDLVDQDEFNNYIQLIDSSSKEIQPCQPKEIQKRYLVSNIFQEQDKTQDSNSTDVRSSTSSINLNRTPSRRLINPDVFNSKEIDMPKLIEQLRAENETLKRENESLRRETFDLREENQALRKQLSQQFSSKRNKIL